MGNEEEKKVRVTFIGMLFAIVVADLAQKITGILYLLTSGWVAGLDGSLIIDNLKENNWAVVAASLHCGLALIMIAMSWMMWSKSQSASKKGNIDSLFSIQLVLLILEVLLVVLYFALVETVDVSRSNLGLEVALGASVSAKPEASILSLVFLLFIVWDFVQDILESPRSDWVPGNIWARVSAVLQGIGVYCFVSMLCFIECVVLLYSIPEKDGTASVILYDIALISVVFLFNSAKKIEFYLKLIFPMEKRRNVTKRDKPMTKSELLVVIGLMLFYIAAILTANWVERCTQ